MAAEAPAGAISAAFPAPPPFYKSFTPENLEHLHRLIDPSSQSSADTLQTTETSITSIAESIRLPAELHHLDPPKPPSDGKYRSFGVLHDTCPTKSTPQKIPTRENLLNLTDRLMRLYHRYVQILATNPSGELWVPQWEEIKRTFEEVHMVINEYRPHEARESLILRYEDQIKQVNEETERVKRSVERAKKVVDELGGGTLKDGTKGSSDEVGRTETTSHLKSSGDSRTTSKEKAVIDVIESEVGSA